MKRPCHFRAQGAGESIKPRQREGARPLMTGSSVLAVLALAATAGGAAGRTHARVPGSLEGCPSG